MTRAARSFDAQDLSHSAALGSHRIGWRVGVADSRGLRDLVHVKQFLGLEQIVSVAEARRARLAPDVALVWGRKSTGHSTTSFADAAGIPVCHLEDGWIRTCDPDAHSRRTYSLLLDPDGVYYDASTPSLIERELSLGSVAAGVPEAALRQVRDWRLRLVEEGISKYNWVSPNAVHLPDKDFVLVIDQTRDDASVRYGGGDQQTFEAMLDAAIAENPGCEVVVRTHPDVVVGRRSGYLSQAARRGVRLVAGNDSLYPWLQKAVSVYTVTSQAGYEALLAGVRVVVFGAPFYAGWGLTDDRSSHPAIARRQGACEGARSVDELFHAAHVSLCRYRSPIDGAEWSLGDCLDHVSLQRKMHARNRARIFAVGITPWKRRYVERYLRSPGGSLRFGSRSAAERAIAQGEVDTVVTWSFRPTPTLPESVKLWRLEDGFVRSVGLGSDYTAPGSLVVDTSGLYFDAGGACDLETLLNEHECTPQQIFRASRLKKRIIELGVSKYGGGKQGQTLTRPADRHVVLVVGQVETDESIRRGCFGVASNSGLLRAARKQRPNDWIVYRPHPDVASGNRKGAVDAETLAACADAIDESPSIHATLEAVDEVHVMTSLTGFEALLRGLKVTTWGAPFYAGWGLTDDKETVPRRQRLRTLEELIYLALIEYPRYLDIGSGEFVPIETFVDSIQQQQQAVTDPVEPSWGQRQLYKLGNIVSGLNYAP